MPGSTPAGAAASRRELPRHAALEPRQALSPGARGGRGGDGAHHLGRAGRRPDADPLDFKCRRRGRDQAVDLGWRSPDGALPAQHEHEAARAHVRELRVGAGRHDPALPGRRWTSTASSGSSTWGGVQPCDPQGSDDPPGVGPLDSLIDNQVVHAAAPPDPPQLDLGQQAVRRPQSAWDRRPTRGSTWSRATTAARRCSSSSYWTRCCSSCTTPRAPTTSPASWPACSTPRTSAAWHRDLADFWNGLGRPGRRGPELRQRHRLTKPQNASQHNAALPNDTKTTARGNLRRRVKYDAPKNATYQSHGATSSSRSHKSLLM